MADHFHPVNLEELVIQWFRIPQIWQLPPPNFPGYALRVGQWNISPLWMMAWVKPWACCGWNRRHGLYVGLVFVTDTCGGFVVGKKLTLRSWYLRSPKWIKVLISRGFLSFWKWMANLNITQLKRKIIFHLRWFVDSQAVDFSRVYIHCFFGPSFLMAHDPGAGGDDGADFGAFERPATLACWQVTKGVEHLCVF